MAEFAKALDCEVAGALQFDPALFGTAANNGQMLSEVQPKAKSVEALMDVARKVLGRSDAKGSASRSSIRCSAS